MKRIVCDRCGKSEEIKDDNEIKRYLFNGIRKDLCKLCCKEVMNIFTGRLPVIEKDK